ncbi:glycoside hydrolase family 44 protein [Tengunoibacter tsumagoiensis]|uniref:Glycoside hydrolase family 44 domain-containing protein n=1 Tax=Tengunoibacter tsumagoiensis TaxID=2014871 RepID=A0A402A720_9CHLR|nr:glycoside hydrolase family 44 protein [Tengunoibacter tsumagoiensis]GCE14898.1 hypothetical protein KTT_47570 [Tengunoibacter tsumagoiensis]
MHTRSVKQVGIAVILMTVCLAGTFNLVPHLFPLKRALAASSGPALSVDAAANQHAIDSGIYGMAQYQLDTALQSELKLPMARWGGDGTTTYNWLQDAYTTASYADFISGNGETNPTPSGQVDTLVSAQQQWGGQTVVTVPFIGYVTKSSLYNCSYLKSQYPPQWGYFPYIHPNGDDCGNGKYADPPHDIIPDTNLNNNYIPSSSTLMKDWIDHLTNKYGPAATSKIIYQMDNEPENWLITQFDIHPDPTGFDEIVNKTIDYAAMVKAADSTSRVMGPSNGYPYGYIYMGSNSKSGDNYASHNSTPWLPYYLQSMKTYEQQHGTRLLDYLDVHFYGDSSSEDSATEDTPAANAARLDSTRALWDPTYTGDSALNKYIPGEQPQDKLGVIGELHRWINEYYPGTKLSISEYDFGNHDHLNGALTQADVLGIFGREGLDSADLFYDPKSTDPVAYTYRMYLNYDGNGGRFGDTSVQATSGDQSQLSVYAAKRSSDNALTLMLVNKTANDLTSPLALNNFSTSASSAQVYTYSGANLSTIVHQADAPISGNSLTTTYPANSITLLVIPNGSTVQPTPTPTPGTGGTVTLTPIADRDNYASSTGSETTLNVSQYQYDYLKFDLSSVSNVNSAHLRLYRGNNDQGTITMNAYQESNNGWTEGSNSLPAPGSQITSLSSSDVGYVDFDVSSYIQSAKASGNTVTLVVNSSNVPWEYFYSRESGSNKPQLVLGTSSSASTLTPTADRDNYASSTGSETTLNVSQYQYDYLKFDLSSVSSVNSAHLRLYRGNNDQGTITMNAYQESNNGWTEGSNSLPAPGSQITSLSSSDVGYVDFDVSSYIQSAKASGNTVTLVVNSSNVPWEYFYSRESGSNKPQLVIQ